MGAGVSMIVDSFSCLVLLPEGGQEALSLPEFGQQLGSGIRDARNNAKVDAMVLYSPTIELVIERPCFVEIDDEHSGWCKVPVTSRVAIPMTTGDAPLHSVAVGLLRDIPLFQTIPEFASVPELDELPPYVAKI